jgi:hypothetical protein
MEREKETRREAREVKQAEKAQRMDLLRKE